MRHERVHGSVAINARQREEKFAGVPANFLAISESYEVNDGTLAKSFRSALAKVLLGIFVAGVFCAGEDVLSPHSLTEACEKARVVQGERVT